MALLRPCKTSAAYEAIPERELRLDLAALEARLASHGWHTLASAGLLLVLRKGVDDATLFQSGKVLIKTTDRSVAERVWGELEPLVGGPAHGC